MRRETGNDAVAACNLSSALKGINDFKSLKKAFNSVLYRGAESGYTGVVPIILRPDAEGRIGGVKMIAVAPDAEALAELEKKYEAIVGKLQRQPAGKGDKPQV